MVLSDQLTSNQILGGVSSPNGDDGLRKLSNQSPAIAISSSEKESDGLVEDKENASKAPPAVDVDMGVDEDVEISPKRSVEEAFEDSSESNLKKARTNDDEDGQLLETKESLESPQDSSESNSKKARINDNEDGQLSETKDSFETLEEAFESNLKKNRINLEADQKLGIDQKQQSPPKTCDSSKSIDDLLESLQKAKAVLQKSKDTLKVLKEHHQKLVENGATMEKRVEAFDKELTKLKDVHSENGKELKKALSIKENAKEIFDKAEEHLRKLHETSKKHEEQATEHARQREAMRKKHEETKAKREEEKVEDKDASASIAWSELKKKHEDKDAAIAALKKKYEDKAKSEVSPQDNATIADTKMDSEDNTPTTDTATTDKKETDDGAVPEEEIAAMDTENNDKKESDDGAVPEEEIAAKETGNNDMKTDEKVDADEIKVAVVEDKDVPKETPVVSEPTESKGTPSPVEWKRNATSEAAALKDLNESPSDELEAEKEVEEVQKTLDLMESRTEDSTASENSTLALAMGKEVTDSGSSLEVKPSTSTMATIDDALALELQADAGESSDEDLLM